MVSYIKARVDGKYPAQMHEECYYKTYPNGAGWKTMVMNGFFRGSTCSRCGTVLMCKCSKFKVSQPETGECKHA